MNLMTIAIGLTTFLLCLSLLHILNKGFVKRAGILLTHTFFLVITISVFSFGGVRNIVVYFLLILATALILGSRAVVLFGSLSILSVSLYYYLLDRGIIREVPLTSSTLEWFMVASLLAVATLLLRLAVIRIGEGFNEATRSEERYRNLVDLSPDGILVHCEGDVVFTNRAAVRIFKGSVEGDLIGRKIFDFVHPNNWDLVHERISKIQETGKTADLVEEQLLCLDGSIIDAEVVGAPTIFQGKPSVQIVVREIAERKLAEAALKEAHEKLEARVKERTIELAQANEELEKKIIERQQMEERLLQSQKMEAIGRLAGGVAHDFNNLLTAIVGYTDILLQDTKSRDPNHDKLTEIKKAADRATDLTRRLLTFSRKQILQPRVINLNLTIREMETMLRRLIGEDIELITKLHDDLDCIKADSIQLGQVIMNLAVNSRDAMPNGGRFTIETDNVKLTKITEDFLPRVKPGHYVQMTISDTGIGMDEKTQAHIFEPFFTTKEKDKGTGLGLSTIYGIIAQSGGCVRVNSVIGKGATFKIYLPQVDESPDASTEPLVDTVNHQGNETILLVEDEEVVRSLIEQILLEKGYKARVAKDANEAKTICQQECQDIQLAITDVVMPGSMSGVKLAEELQKINPKIQILFISGYTDENIIQQGVLKPEVAFLQKPFTPAALLTRVRELLSKREE